MCDGVMSVIGQVWMCLCCVNGGREVGGGESDVNVFGDGRGDGGGGWIGICM